MKRREFTVFGMTFSSTRTVWAKITPPKDRLLNRSRWVAEVNPAGDHFYSVEYGKWKVILKLNKLGEVSIGPKEYLLVTKNYNAVFYHDLNPWVKTSHG